MKTVTKTINIADRFFAATTISSAVDEPTAKQDQQRDEDQHEDHRRRSQRSNGIHPMNSGSRSTMVLEGDRSRAGLLNQRLDGMATRIAADYAEGNPWNTDTWNTDNRPGKVTECRCGRFT
jgi:hypothetical protein